MQKTQKQKLAEFEFIINSNNSKLMLLWLKERQQTISCNQMLTKLIQKEKLRLAIFNDDMRFCPCCEGKPEISDTQSHVTIRCSKCGLSLTASSKEDAKEKWNRRP